ncbi:MAG: VWA domain-containing protein [Pyrinomonadaceae bacterium]|nr:VWA domain-containing protein [Pyrinomonadaceae bacterium]
MFPRWILVCLIIAAFAFTAFTQTKNISEGSLQVIDQNGKSKGFCPLKKTEVKAEISGFLSRVSVTQTFQNPFDTPIEAVYTFPLPNDAAVDEMTIQIDKRIVKAKIMERQKAQETYEKARQEGKVAALLEQQRPNIFTQSVANILPNAEIKVVISYVETLKYIDGTYEFSFPMTIGERYIPFSQAENPDSSSQTGVPDASKIVPPSEKRPAHTVSLELKLDAGVPLESFESNTHEIETQQLSANTLALRLKDEEEIPNRDFVLKYKTAGNKIKDAVLTHRSAKGGFFNLILQPPAKVIPAETMPKEVVFVLDTSGSMSGMPIEKARESMKLTLDGLNPNDTFNLITFAGETKILFDKPVPASKENLEKAQNLLNGVKSSGGTEMMKAIKAALEPSDATDHVRIVCFMTDGYVGNEAEIISEVQKHPNARVFGFGIGHSVNHYLLDEISREGRGEVEYVNLKDDGSKAARRFYERIRNPLLTDVSIDIQGVQTAENFPQKVPDLFDVRPVSIVGRYLNGGNAKIILRGKMAGKDYSREIPFKFPEQNKANDVLATLWARRKVADLSRQDFQGLQTGKMKDELKQAITNLGLEFRLLTPFTSFVAVEEKVVNEGGENKTVEVPVAIPFGQEPEVQTLPINGRAYSMVTVTSTSTVDTTESVISTVTEYRSLAQIAKAKSSEVPLNIPPGTVNVSEIPNVEKRGLVSSNGQQPTANLFRVDGNIVNIGVSADETSIAKNGGATPALTASGSTIAFIAEDALDEISITSFNGTPKQQQSGGIDANFTSRGGTNMFHGSAFGNFGGKGLNANNFFANARNLPRAESSLKQFGGTVGGFIKKDKAFFFSNYEGLRLKQPAFAVSEVPTIFSRQNASAAMQPLLNSFSIPNGQNTQNGLAEFASTFTNPASHNNFGLKIDAAPNNQIQIGGRLNLTNSEAETRGNEGFSLNTLRRFDIDTKTFSGKVTVVPTSAMILSGRISFARNLIAQKFSLDNFGGANVAQNLFASSFTKYDFLGKNSALASGDRISTEVNQFESVGGLDVVAGNHTFNFSGNFRRLAFDFGANPNERNVVLAGVTNSLNGIAARINEISRNNLATVNLNNFALTAEDSFKIKPETTLNFGVRWDVNSAPNNLWKTKYSNFAPRIGLAQGLFNQNAVFRAGVGLFYDLGNPVATDYFANSAPNISGKSAQNVIFNSLPTTQFLPNTIFDSNLRTPRIWHFSFGYQQQITRNLSFYSNYINSTGRKLYFFQTNGLTRHVSNEAKSDYQALQIGIEHRYQRGFFAMANYTLARSKDNFSPDSPRRAIVQQGDGTSDFDAKHNFKGVISYTPPVLFESQFLKAITRDWTFGTVFTRRSALPLNIMYARINDFGFEYYRPNLVNNTAIYQSNGEINPQAFAVPNSTLFGNLERNSVRGNSLFQLDFGVSRQVKITNEISVTFSANASNLLNTHSLANPNNVIGTQTGNTFVPNATFGKNLETFGSNSWTSFNYAGGARTIHFSARFKF